MATSPLTFVARDEGRTVFLRESGENVGTAWTGPDGCSGFALHMGRGEGPICRGVSESLTGATTDLFAAYVRETGSDAAFPEQVSA